MIQVVYQLLQIVLILDLISTVVVGSTGPCSWSLVIQLFSGDCSDDVLSVNLPVPMIISEDSVQVWFYQHKGIGT